MKRRVAILRYGAWNFAFFAMLIALNLTSSGLAATDPSACVSSGNRELDNWLGNRKSIESIVSLVFTHMQFQRVYLRLLPTNRPSLELARKLGFQEEGLHRREFRCGFGESHGVHHLALIIPDWDYRRKEIL
jgi:hypothetical protein